jgi:LuxR family maltose regulon positive regulatory protein
MSAPILATKLYIPPPRPKAVLRPRLIERLNAGIASGCKLTLISAPAGFGKTTLVSEWVAMRARAVAWLSLDEEDNIATRFLTYLIAALQTIAADIGTGALGMLQTPQPPPIESILTPLLNEISAVPDPFSLVLDDYHVIAAQPVDAALTFLIEHLPPQMHLIITTREDPPLPLARLRARGQLSELRAADLRFTPAEAADFLNQGMGLTLSAEDITALEARTEGWIAGLQLAAISMQGHADVTHFIQSFTGSHHFVLDYLVEEVLQQQPANIQAFLLQSSILERLCGSLCDAVVLDPTTSGQATLEYLEHANLFTLPLDNERQWYRYHRLFADLLRQRLHQNAAPSAGNAGKGVAELHSRASLWYEHNGLESEAFQHAIAAQDFARAADLAELAWQAMDDTFQTAAWLGWIKKLPDGLIRFRPVLCTQIAIALMDNGELEASEAHLQDAERWLDPQAGSAQSESSSGRMVVVDEELFQTLPARIALVRAYNAQVRGDIAATVKYAELALTLTPEEDHLMRAQTTITLEITHWTSGNLESARRAMTSWISSMQKAGNVIFAIASAFALADILVAQGQLHAAVKTYQQALQLAAEHDQDAQRITAHHHLGLALIYHEQNNPGTSAQHMLKAGELGKQTTLVDWVYRWNIAQAQLKEADGDLESALDLLDEAKRHYVRTPVPDLRPVEALKAKVYLKQGKLAKAQDWARERGLSTDDELSYLGEFEHITLVRVLMAEYQSNPVERSISDAVRLLDRLLEAAQADRRMGSAIEILVMQALAQQASNNIPLALAALERALALAEPEGYIRIFVDEGLPMSQLLPAAAKQGIMPGYTAKLLAAFGMKIRVSENPANRSPVQPLIEPLSQRELEVLRLIANGLSNAEISKRLFLALSTVKGHNRMIFDKLQVQSRTEAIARARELGLL